MIGELFPPSAAGLLVLASAVVLVVGPRMAAAADRLADVRGLGEAFVGAVLVGIERTWSMPRPRCPTSCRAPC